MQVESVGEITVDYESQGWVSFGPISAAPVPSDMGEAQDGRRLELADVGRLARRAMRSAVRAARAGEGLAFSSLLRAHLPGGIEDLSVVEESWPAYDHINVQAGLDAWLAVPGRTHELVGVIGFQHSVFGLAELLGAGDELGPMGMGMRPGNVARANLPAGPDGAVRPCV
ncbi:MAG: ATPase, partial [Pseudonocardiales bacterium]|nr:ATPase [Pseudonocardiales bacterium]